MYVLNSVQAPSSICHAVGARVLLSEERALVVVRPKTLEVYKGVRMLEMEAFSEVDERIVAVAAIRPKGAHSDRIAVFLELHTLLVLALDGGFNTVFAVCFSNLGHQNIIDSDAFLVPDSGENTTFLVVHCFLGVILVVFLPDLANGKVSHNGPKKRSFTPKTPTKTFSIGNIVVHSMVMLQMSEKPTLAVLYRDFNFNFSLRYYAIDPASQSFTLTKQFDEFDDTPTVLVAAPFGGVFLASELHLFYFPNPLVSLVSVETAKNDLLASTDRMVVTKKLYEDGTADFIAQTFVCHAVVDEKRIVFLNDVGEASVLYMDMVSSTRAVTVKSLELIRLGMATIPSALVHIDANVFFASSRLSQSVVFEVLPTDPHISICQFFPSSPPVLSIDLIKEGLLSKVVACQGGQNSGEIRKYSLKDYTISSLSSVTVDPASVRLNLIVDGISKHTLGLFDVKNVLSFDCQVDTTEENATVKVRKALQEYSFIDLKRINGAHYSITDSAIDIDDEILEDNVAGGVILLSGTTFYVNKENSVVFLPKSGQKKTHKLSLSDSNLTSIDATKVSRDTYATLVTFAGGDFELVLFTSSSSKTLVFSLVDAEPGIFASAIVYFPQTASLAVIMLTSDGRVLSGDLALKPQRELPLHTVIKSSGIPLQMVKNTAGDVLLFNSSEILIMRFDFATNAFKVSPIDLACGASDIVYLNDSKIAVLRQAQLEILLLEAYIGTNVPQTIFSNDLKKKSYHVPGTSYSVVLASETKLDAVSGELESSSYLQLINDGTMQMTHEYRHILLKDIVDVAFVPQAENIDIPKHTFVAVNNSGNKDETFLLFRIKKGKIMELPRTNVQGLASVKDLSMLSIELISRENLTYLVSGNTNFIIQLLVMGTDFIWKLHTNSLVQLPAFTMRSVICNGIIVMGDIIKGLFTGTMEEEEVDSEELSLKTHALHLEQEPTFLTAFDLVSEEENKCSVVFGDSLGNISVARVEKGSHEPEQIASFNMGELTNVVKSLGKDDIGDFHSKFFNSQQNSFVSPTALLGTVYGGVYSLSRIISVKHNETVERCVREIAAYVFKAEAGKKDHEAPKKAQAQHDWRTLRRDGSGSFIKHEHYGIIDLASVHRWLIEDNQLKQQKQSQASSTKLAQMKKQLPQCYKNKDFLQQLVHQTSLL